MRLSEVRPLIDRLAEDYGGDFDREPQLRMCLAEAFMAGVRSQGLRYQKDSALWAACGCEPTSPADAKKESK